MNLYTTIYEKVEQNGGKHFIKNLENVLNCFFNMLPWDQFEPNDEEYISAYLKIWNNYKTSAKLMNNVANHFNWIESESGNNERAGANQTFKICMELWKKGVFDPAKSRLFVSILKMIDLQRSGEIMSSTVIRNIVACIQELGEEQEFERHYLERTKLFYARKQAETADLESILNIFLAEEFQGQLVLSQTRKITAILGELLVNQNMDDWKNEFQKLLTSENNIDLTKMYQIISRVPEKLVDLQLILGKNISNSMIQAIEKCDEGGEAALNPKIYVEAILKVHRKFRVMILTAFNSDERFRAALDKACADFVNSNSVTSNELTSPQMLAIYCDIILRKSSKIPEEMEVEDSLDQVMIIFRYITDKDVFQEFYSKLLAKRLIFKTSVSHDDEASMISKLKQHCGFEYTRKFEQMIKDIGLCQDLNEKFKKYKTDGQLGSLLDFQHLVLSAGCWPFHQGSSLILPTLVSFEMNILVKNY